ncbi:uncharacterized protein LOC121404254 [Drosophila obscura]|uniref:uncharacterized protein LOC121404254 n=1 Tax=Drosophila obscura TaxID=7282 RepID=UPI001BB14AC4|nr:uncharacterized protein LOC121404254 [Drosophila obscura]
MEGELSIESSASLLIKFRSAKGDHAVKAHPRQGVGLGRVSNARPYFILANEVEQHPVDCSWPAFGQLFQILRLQSEAQFFQFAEREHLPVLQPTNEAAGCSIAAQLY